MQTITRAAVELFSEEGYAAVSTRRIAERAGCSETLLFRYFRDKRGLLMAICRDLRVGDGRDVRPPREEFVGVEEFLERYLVGRFANLRDQALPLKVVVAALINDEEMTADFGPEHDDAVAYVAEVLRGFQWTGVIDPTLDVDAAAIAIEQVSFAIGFLLQLVLERPAEELDTLARACASVLSRGMEPPPGPVGGPRTCAALASVRDARRHLATALELLVDG